MTDYRGLFDMDGAVALVRWGGGAIGSEMARTVATFGAKVVPLASPLQLAKV